MSVIITDPHEIIDHVRNNQKVRFTHYRNGQLWYVTEKGFHFPVPIEDTGEASFPAEEKAILFMRYIRLYVEKLSDERLDSGGTN